MMGDLAVKVKRFRMARYAFVTHDVTEVIH